MAPDRDALGMFRLPIPALAPHLLLGQVELVAGVAADLENAAVRVGCLARVATWDRCCK